MTVETTTSKTGEVEHIILPGESLLQRGSDDRVVACGHIHFDTDDTKEYESVEDVDNPCQNCLNRL